jgi:hypothetical protein
MAARNRTTTKSKKNPLSISNLPEKRVKGTDVKGGKASLRPFKSDSCNSNTLTCKDTSKTNTLCCE